MSIDFDFDQFPTLLQMAQSDAYIKVVLGPAGSAKTSAIATRAFFAACEQKPNSAGVRRTRTVVARGTYNQLAAATVPTWRTMLGEMVTISDAKPPKGFAKVPLPDGTTVEWEIQFLALDGMNAAADILGLEPTNIVLDEMSTMNDEALVLNLISRLGRYPSMKDGGPTHSDVWGSTNGPRKNHWLYDWTQGKRNKEFDMMGAEMKRPYFKLFQQPPALLKALDGTWAPNPLAENIMNLQPGYNYYFAMLARPWPEIQAYVLGQFADLQTGKAVFPQFRRDLHVVDQADFMLNWGARGPICMTFDFGRTPVCLIGVTRPTGGLVIVDELMGQDVSIDEFFKETVAPMLAVRYGNCSMQHCVGDPAGHDSTQAVDTSPFKVLHGYGIPIQYPAGQRKDTITPRIEATRQRLSRLGSGGVPMLQITSNCKYLIDALSHAYIFEEVRGQDAFKETPTKSHVGWVSDLADALQYLCLSLSGELEPARHVQQRPPMAPAFGG